MVYQYLSGDILVKIKRIGPLSMGLIQGGIMAFFGIIVGVIYALIGLVFSGVSGDMGMAGIMFGLGFLLVLIIPIIYGIMGFIGGLLMALIYNLIAGWTGGLELDME